jgi:hypothetical protein
VGLVEAGDGTRDPAVGLEVGRDHLVGRRTPHVEVHFEEVDAFEVGVHRLEEDIVELVVVHVDNFCHHIHHHHLDTRRHILDREDMKAVELEDREGDHSRLERIHSDLDEDGKAQGEPLLNLYGCYDLATLKGVKRSGA